MNIMFLLLLVVLGAVVGWLVPFCLGRLRKKVCPHCNEWIPARASVCPICKEAVPVEAGDKRLKALPVWIVGCAVVLPLISVLSVGGLSLSSGRSVNDADSLAVEDEVCEARLTIEGFAENLAERGGFEAERDEEHGLIVFWDDDHEFAIYNENDGQIYDYGVDNKVMTNEGAIEIYCLDVSAACGSYWLSPNGKFIYFAAYKEEGEVPVQYLFSVSTEDLNDVRLVAEGTQIKYAGDCVYIVITEWDEGANRGDGAYLTYTHFYDLNMKEDPSLAFDITQGD